MEKITEFIKKYDKPLTKEQLEKIIYNIFCVLIFITPIIPETIGFGLYSLKATIFNITTIMTAITLIIINRNNIRNVKVNVYDVLLIAYLFLVILSTIFSKYGIVECILGRNGRGEGLLTIFNYITTFVIFSRGYKELGVAAKFAVISAIILSIYSVIQANIPKGVEIPFLPESPYKIATGTMRNQNFLSSYICIFLPMTCFYYINGNDKLKRTLCLAALFFATLVYSVTLGGYITFAFMAITMMIFSIYFSKNRKNTITRILIISFTLTTTFILINYEPKEKANSSSNIYIEEVSSVKQEVENLSNQKSEFGNGRFEIWQKCLKVVYNNPLLGVGPDSLMYELLDKSYITKGKEDILNRYRVDKAHCEPLHIAATTGIPSALIYITLVGIIGIRLLVLVIKYTNKKRNKR